VAASSPTGPDDYGPVWTRAKKPGRRPALTREAIVTAAVKIADAEGLSAVSIRRVAAELDARAMSLYSHIARKEDLLDLMRDEVAREFLIEGELPGHWREAVGLIARRSRESMLRHPWIVDLHGQSTSLGPNALRHADQSMEALNGLGLDNLMAWRILNAVDHYVLGSVIFETVQLRRGPNKDVLRPYLEEIAASGRYPYLEPLLKTDLPVGETEETFERGLAWLLDGIERDLASHT
jgi:AcrR family transcriptional regulator